MNKGMSWFNVTSIVAGFAFLYIPILLLVIYSFNASRLVTVWAGFSFQWYASLLENEQLLDAAWVTLRVAFISSLVATVFGTMAALALTRYGRFFGRTLFSGMTYAPLVMPEVITGLSLLLLFVAIGFERGFWTITLAHITFTMWLRGGGGAVAARHLRPVAGGSGPRSRLPAVQDLLHHHLAADPAGGRLGLPAGLHALHGRPGHRQLHHGARATTLPMRIYSQVRLGVTPEINAACTILIAIVTVVVLIASVVTKHQEKVREAEERAAAAQ